MKQDLIYKMLFSEEKVELSSEKVELKNVKEIQRIQDGVSKDFDILDKELGKLYDKRKELDKFQKEYNELVSQVEAGIGLLEKNVMDFKKDADALGLGNAPIIQGTLKEAKSRRNQLKRYKQDVKK
jgi:hypothetical protein